MAAATIALGPNPVVPAAPVGAHGGEAAQNTGAEEVVEAVSRVQESLARSSGVDGWTVEVVGGEARGGAVHDTGGTEGCCRRATAER